MRAPNPRQTIASALLSDARSRAGLTQLEVARRAGIARPSISQYETGKKDPSVTTLRRLVQACGMELVMRADPLSAAERAQLARDDAIGQAQARRNSVRARAHLVKLSELTPAEARG